MIRALNQTGLRRSRRDPLGLLWVWAIVCSLLGIVTPVADTIAGDAPEEEKVATSEKSEGSKDDEKLDDSEPDKGKDDAAQDDASKDGNELDAPVPDQSKDEASAPPEGDGRKLAPITPARMVEPIPDELRSRLELAPFYAKCVLADGFPILGSERVADAALLEAAHLIDTMLTGRNDVREELIRNRVRFVVMATSELTTQIPEYSDLTPSRYWDRRARGLGATRERPVVSCGEENLLGFPGDPYREENILVHEFAHAIHALGLPADFDRRLRETYDQAMARGLWRGKYAATNHHEYWAEAVQSWFGTNRPPDHDHNHVDSRPELIEY
ncbi:MAG TPA: hypothetical protein VK116_11925, partial [Planctomycetota bacterium]|nr:hypothetical protein [Planctomycetota bacterium]